MMVSSAMMRVPRPAGPVGDCVIFFSSSLPTKAAWFAGLLTMSKIFCGEALMLISALYEKSAMEFPSNVSD